MVQPNANVQVAEWLTLLRQGNAYAVREWLDELQPYDLAQLYLALSPGERGRLLRHLTKDEIAAFLEELDIRHQAELIDRLGLAQAAEILSSMSPDDLVALLGRLSAEKAKTLLASMDPAHAARVKQLMAYAHETAGAIMTDRFVWVTSDITVREAFEKLRDFADVAEVLNYLYVVDQDRRLVGVLSIRDLLQAREETPVADIMYERVISVPADMDQEEVASVIERYDFVAVPVVDHKNRLLGIVTVDDVLDVIFHEAGEDLAKLSATSQKAVDLRTSPLQGARRRLPWLLLLLVIGILTGSIVSRYEDTLKRVVALAFFMPMIAGMTGNTGTQSLAIVIRTIAEEGLPARIIFRLAAREAGSGIIIGLVCGAVVAVVAGLWQHNLALGAVVGLTLFLTLIVGTLAGTLIPIVLHFLRIDPVVASGPLITTLNDVISLLIYFSIARLFLSWFLA